MAGVLLTRGAGGRFTGYVAASGPAAAAKSSIVSSAAIGAAVGATESTLLSFADPLFRELGYATNWLWPNRVPDVAEIISSWSHGPLTYSTMRDMLYYHGIALPVEELETADQLERHIRDESELLQFTGDAPSDAIINTRISQLFNRTTWSQVVSATQQQLPLETLVKLRLLGRISDNQYDYGTIRHGFKQGPVRTQLLNQPWVQSPQEERIYDKLRQIAEQPPGPPDPQRESDYAKRLAAAGVVEDADRTVFARMIQPPTYLEAVELAQRDLLLLNGVPDANNPGQNRPATPAEQRSEFNRLMALEGFTDDTVIDYLWSLRQRLPTEGELIEAAVKNAFVGPLAKILGLDQEYEDQPQFIVGTDRLGLSGSPFISRNDMRQHLLNQRKTREDAGLDVEAEAVYIRRADEYFQAQDRTLLTWAQVFWRSHWVNLSPSQIYECLQRQRVIDSTKPGSAAALQSYETSIEAITAIAEGADAAARRYAVACYYAMRIVPNFQDPTQPGTPGLGFGRNPEVPPITIDIVNAVLRANDYAPLFRPNLAAISYNVLRLVDIRRLVQLSLMDEIFAGSAIGYNEAVGIQLPGTDNGGSRDPLQKFVFAWAREQFEDRGQTHDSAQALATLAVSQGQTTNRLRMRQILALYDRAYRVGLITASRLRELRREPIVPGSVPTSAGDFGETSDVFSEADLIADMYDEGGAIDYLGEQTAIAAAEDQIEEGDAIA